MIKINLLPIEKKQEKIAEKQNIGFLIICIGVFIILGIIIFVLYSFDKTIEFNVSSKNENISSASASLNSYTDIKNKVFFIKDRLKELNSQKSNSNWTSLLSSLSDATPAGITLTSLDVKITSKPQIDIKGNSGSSNDVVKFKENLENSKYFSNVNFKSSSKSVTDGVETTDFNLTANLEGK